MVNFADTLPELTIPRKYQHSDIWKAEMEQRISKMEKDMKALIIAKHTKPKPIRMFVHSDHSVHVHPEDC